MADFAGLTQLAVFPDAQLSDNDSAVKAYSRIAPDHPRGSDALGDTILGFMTNLVAGPGKPDHVVNNEFVADWDDHWSGFKEFFENYHVIPRQFAFGNILSTQTSPLNVFSGFRRTFGVWSSFVNNAGAGTTLLGMPTLPAVMSPLQGHEMTLEVTTNGNPSVDDDLAFVFDFGGTTINVPISLNRIVLFPVRPEIPYVEKLKFLTDIIRTADGSEQRIAIRKNPRQFFDWDVRMDDMEWDKQRVDTLMFDWQSRIWGVPMWHEATTLTVAAAVGTLTVNVDTTADADYRVDGLVMIFADSQTFDVQTISSFTANTITLKNATLNAFSVGATVAPLRTGNLRRSVSSSRFRSADQKLRLSFRIIDNDSDLADTSAFDSYNSKVLLDTCNVMVSSTLAEQFVRELIVIDNPAGIVTQDSPWDSGMHGFPLTLRAYSKAELWDLRQLVHALRGKQVSFYVPTFNHDLTPTGPLASASQDLVIENIGYTQFVRGRQPKNHIWMRLLDGTVYTREITSYVETTTALETLTMNAAWGADIALADIDRISYLEEVRFNSDDITIRHERGDRLVHVSAPVITTFE